jgi:hypothetical protein
MGCRGPRGDGEETVDLTARMEGGGVEVGDGGRSLAKFRAAPPEDARIARSIGELSTILTSSEPSATVVSLGLRDFMGNSPRPSFSLFRTQLTTSREGAEFISNGGAEAVARTVRCQKSPSSRPPSSLAKLSRDKHVRRHRLFESHFRLRSEMPEVLGCKSTLHGRP